MLGIEKRIDLLLKAVEEDNFEPNVFDLIREGKLDVVPDTEGQPLFIYFHEGQFTSVDINGNILNDIKTREKTECIDDNDEMQNYYQIMNILDSLATNNKRPSQMDLLELEKLRITSNFEIEDIADANDCKADSWIQLVCELIKLHESGDRVKVKEEKIMSKTNESLYWESLFPNYKTMKPATSMDIKLTKNITLSLFRAEEDFPAYDLHIYVNEDSDAIFEDNMVRDWVVYDKPNPWKTTESGEPYYVSPKTGWVYMFYELRGLNTKYPNTDRMCCVCEFSSERELLEDGCEGYEVEDIVGWEYVIGSNIPKDDFVNMINAYEGKHETKKEVIKTLQNKLMIDGYVMDKDEITSLKNQIDTVTNWL